MKIFPINEYGVLQTFVLGMLVHGLLQTGRRKDIPWVLGMFAAALIGAWFVVEPGERAFGLPLLGGLIFAVVFAVVYGPRLLPRITGIALLDCTAMLYYSVYLSWQASGVGPLPTSIIVVGLLPALFVLAVALIPLTRLKFFRILAYVWHLIVLVGLVFAQWQISDLQSLGANRQFPPALFLYAFMAGGALMYVVFNCVQILILLPVRQNRLERALLGAYTADRDQADRMAERFGAGRPGILPLMFLLIHGAVMALNIRFAWIPDGVFITGSILGLAWIGGKNWNQSLTEGGSLKVRE